MENLLTIAIPTYNRSFYLNNCLNFITKQLNINCQEIDIIVSDNCSTDNTFEIVNNYILEGFKIKYIKNKINLGADFNIGQCYSVALTQFVLVLGDDDYLINGSIYEIIKLLKKNMDCGVVHISKIYTKKCTNKNNEIKKYNSIDFIKKTNFKLIFISENIVNKKFLNKINFHTDIDTFLNQLHITFESIFNAPYNIHFNTELLTSNNANSSIPSNFLDIFVYNLDKILHRLNSKYFCKNLKKIFIHKRLNWVLPLMLLEEKKKKKDYTIRIKLDKNLFKSNYKYIYFWIYFIPIYFMPYKIATIYFRILHFKKFYLK